jgi:hypothetical protein
LLVVVALLLHLEVAHVFWAAVLSNRSSSGGRTPSGTPPPRPATRSAPPPPRVRGIESSALRAAEPQAINKGKPPTVPPPAEAPPEQRWINAELEDHAPNEPLDVGKWYTLAFDVDVAQRASAAGATPLDDAKLFAEGTDELQLTVQLIAARRNF